MGRCHDILLRHKGPSTDVVSPKSPILKMKNLREAKARTRANKPLLINAIHGHSPNRVFRPPKICCAKKSRCGTAFLIPQSKEQLLSRYLDLAELCFTYMDDIRESFCCCLEPQLAPSNASFHHRHNTTRWHQKPTRTYQKGFEFTT